MLNDREISRAKPRATAYRMTDGRGLYLQVTPSGGKLWRFKYRFGGSEKLMSLGPYPDVPLVVARDRHSQARRLLSEGIDPMAERKAEKVAAVRVAAPSSFQAVSGLWLEHWRVGKSAQHVDATRRRLVANVYPHIGGRPIVEVEAPELVAMVKAIEARGVGDLAKRALETVGQIFRYGVAHGHCSRNPAADIRPGDVLRPAVKVNLARIEAGELPDLLRAIEVYRGAVLTRLALKLMAHVFLRTSELIGGEWPEWDREGRRWNIPKERMKMDTPHIVPLSKQVTEILELLYLVTGSGRYMFPGEQGAPTMSNNTLLYALERMNYKGRMTGHGFRGLASTILHEQGWDHNWIELQLAHSKRDKVSSAYNHALYLEGRRTMLQHWSDFLEMQLRGNRQ